MRASAAPEAVLGLFQAFAERCPESFLSRFFP